MDDVLGARSTSPSTTGITWLSYINDLNPCTFKSVPGVQVLVPSSIIFGARDSTNAVQMKRSYDVLDVRVSSSSVYRVQCNG